MKTRLACSVFLLGCFGGSAFAQELWANRHIVLAAADVLATEVEQLDTALHEVNAPAALVQRVHHFEETVSEFAAEVRGGCTYQHAYMEMNHIRQDFGMIRTELMAHPQLLSIPKVSLEFAHARAAYRNLDHQMFIKLAGRYSSAELQEIERVLSTRAENHRR